MEMLRLMSTFDRRIWLVAMVLGLFPAIGLAQAGALSALRASGAVTVADATGEYSALSPRQRLSAGDRLRLGGGAELLWRSRAVLIGLRGPGQMHWAVDPQKSRGRIKVQSGELTAQVSAGQRLSVMGTHAEAVFSDADGLVTVEEDRTTVCAHRGRVEVELPGGGHSLFLRDAGHCVRVLGDRSIAHVTLSKEQLRQRMLLPGPGELPALATLPPPKVERAAEARVPEPVESPTTPAEDLSRQQLVRELEIADKGDWFVVLGAFSEAARAERFRSEIQPELRAVSRIVETPGNALHRVAIGPFGTLKDADSARVLLRSRYPRAWIVQGRP